MVGNKQDIHASVTARIVAQLEQGTRPWVKPWSGEHAAGRISTPLRWNGERYRGINVLVLWLTAEERGYSAPLWLTFKQCKELGGCVKAGEKGTHVVYCDRIHKEEEDKDIFFVRTYTVFNAEQTSGLPARYYQMQAPPLNPVHRDAQADAFIRHTGAAVTHGGTSAHYSKQADRITLPPFQAFRDAEAYYCTAFHELAHWSGAAHRLNRELKGRKDQDAYAFEELIAELASVFVAVELGVTPEPREDHAAYLAFWLDILKSDKRAIFTAAAAAQKAADYLANLQPQA